MCVGGGGDVLGTDDGECNILFGNRNEREIWHHRHTSHVDVKIGWNIAGLWCVYTSNEKNGKNFFRFERNTRATVCCFTQ